LDTIFVNKAGDWKVGGFDLSSPKTDAPAFLKVIILAYLNN
jgi:hypothetical protein